VTKFYQVLYDLIDFITTDERVCPKPFLWSDLYSKMKQESSDRGITTKISLPLILAAWRGSTDAQKRQRLVEQIKFSDSHDFLSVVDLFLRSIPDGDWYRCSETGQQNIPEWVRKEKLQQNLSTEVTILDGELEKLKIFSDEHGHLRVPAKYIDNDGFELGRWVCRCRNDYDNYKLDPKLAHKIESITGWMWNIDGGDVINSDGLEGLKKFIAEYGHTKVPMNYQTIDGFKLGRWVKNCRNNFKNSKLNLDQVKELESLVGWVWDTKKKVKPKL
jgi:hypothetical protein